MTIKEDFSRLNRYVGEARNKKTLSIIDKMGKKKVEDLPSTTDPKIRKRARKYYFSLKKKITKKRKRLKN